MAILNSSVKVPDGKDHLDKVSDTVGTIPGDYRLGSGTIIQRVNRGKSRNGVQGTLWYFNIVIEHGHRNSVFSHEKWWIFPVRYVSHYQRV